MSEFKRYIAVSKILVGQDKENSLTIERGTPVEYDGTTAIIEGDEYKFPRLKSAIKCSWLVDEQTLGLGDLPESLPQSANISMRHPTEDDGEATIASTSISEEETNVGSISEVRQRSSNSDYETSASDAEVVEGITFSTPSGEASKNQTTSVDRLSTNAINNIEEGSAGNKKAVFEEVERRKMARQIESLKRELAQKNQVQVREGIRFETEGVSAEAADTTSSEGTSDVWDGDTSEVVGQVSQPEEEELSLTDKEARLTLARQMLPNFDWDFGTHWKTKLKNLEEDSRPLFVCAVYAVETDAMKKHIASKFPELNLG